MSARADRNTSPGTNKNEAPAERHSPAVPVDLALLAEVSQFLFYEARLQDQHQYQDWEALWTDDALYWVPANGADIDPETQMSIIYDNRSRLSLRVKQLYSGKRHTQNPRSSLCRTISNVEIVGRESGERGEEINTRSNVMIFESNLRDDTLWAARLEHTLRRTGEGLRMAYKKVVLANNEDALYTLSFLI